MDEHLCSTRHETTVSSSIAPRSLPISPELLQRKLAEFYWEVQAKVQAEVAERLAGAFTEIDRAIDEALVFPRLRSGAPAEEVAAIVRQAAVVKEAIKEPLRQRAANAWREDREVMHANAEYARRKMRNPPSLAEPVVTPVTSGAPPLAPPERQLVLINRVTAR